MIIVKTKKNLQDEIKKRKEKNCSIGFVPTMGAFHKGHLALMERANAENDITIVSIFVNPLQFEPDEDYDSYPRTLAEDKRGAEKHGVDILFAPPVEEMYPRPLYNKINVMNGTDVLCGASRPNHFDGVATIVLKLFQLVSPNRAYFGEKDAQQIAVIENMVEDFHVPVDIISVPIVRDKDGLALSSRNKNLTASERSEANVIYKHLQRAADRIRTGESSYDKVKEEVKRSLSTSTSGVVDYFDILFFPSLSKDQLRTDNRLIIATSVKYSKARLIDNIMLDVEPRVR